MANWFKISDFNISGEPIPEDVADKILIHHIIPLNKVRSAIQIPVWPSAKSGYRSLAWEKARGRKGNSQHVFRAEGATDVTCEDFDENKYVLLEALIKCTEYRRFALYDDFIHCDYAGLQRWVFNDEWERMYRIDVD